MADHTMTVVYRRCGRGIRFEVPTMGAPRPNPVARWWRRRTVRLLIQRDVWRLGHAVQNATVYHYVAQCPRGLFHEAETG